MLFCSCGCSIAKKVIDNEESRQLRVAILKLPIDNEQLITIGNKMWPS
jgi:hypothetical protein